ncbi:MAG TPA: hypothetical protein VFR07_01570 [Mycobacteriales bacterium]|jgi:hypothetical protein|nr:hypothetical protein [Mycobacteriales bacterium]
MTQSSLVTSWAVCGIAAAAARFVPVPLLDDVIRRRAAQVAVVRTLRAHGRTGSAEPLEALWGEPEGRRKGVVRKVSRKLLLFPVRKYVAVFGAVRGVPNDVMRVVLLGRAVDRRLQRGELADPEQARALRRAIDTAIAGLDLRLLTAGLADGLSHSRGLSTAAVAYARRRFGKNGEADLEVDGAVAEGAERVTEVLRRPEVAQLLEQYDAAVDRALAAG